MIVEPLRFEKLPGLGVENWQDGPAFDFHASAIFRRSLANQWPRWNARRMSTEILEQELAILKKRVETLEGQIARPSRDAWKDVVGAAKDDDLFEEAMRLGAEWRAQANREGR